MAGGLPFGHVLLVHEPLAIRHVVLDNAANYGKDRMQRRVLSAGLTEGLLSAETHLRCDRGSGMKSDSVTEAVQRVANARVRAAEAARLSDHAMPLDNFAAAVIQFIH